MSGEIDPIISSRVAEARLRPAIYAVLRAGAALGTALLVIGLALWAFAGTPLDATATSRLSLGLLGTVVTTPSATGFLVLGALVLALTPLSRVVLAAGVFASVGDRPLLAVSMFVLFVLSATVVVGVFL